MKNHSFLFFFGLFLSKLSLFSLLSCGKSPVNNVDSSYYNKQTKTKESVIDKIRNSRPMEEWTNNNYYQSVQMEQCLFEICGEKTSYETVYDYAKKTFTEYNKIKLSREYFLKTPYFNKFKNIFEKEIKSQSNNLSLLKKNLKKINDQNLKLFEVIFLNYKASFSLFSFMSLNHDALKNTIVLNKEKSIKNLKKYFDNKRSEKIVNYAEQFVHAVLKQKNYHQFIGGNNISPTVKIEKMKKFFYEINTLEKEFYDNTTIEIFDFIIKKFDFLSTKENFRNSIENGKHQEFEYFYKIFEEIFVYFELFKLNNIASISSESSLIFDKNYILANADIEKRIDSLVKYFEKSLDWKIQEDIVKKLIVLEEKIKKEEKLIPEENNFFLYKHRLESNLFLIYINKIFKIFNFFQQKGKWFDGQKFSKKIMPLIREHFVYKLPIEDQKGILHFLNSIVVKTPFNLFDLHESFNSKIVSIEKNLKTSVLKNDFYHFLDLYDLGLITLKEKIQPSKEQGVSYTFLKKIVTDEDLANFLTDYQQSHSISVEYLHSFSESSYLNMYDDFFMASGLGVEINLSVYSSLYFDRFGVGTALHEFGHAVEYYLSQNAGSVFSKDVYPKITGCLNEKHFYLGKDKYSHFSKNHYQNEDFADQFAYNILRNVSKYSSECSLLNGRYVEQKIINHHENSDTHSSGSFRAISAYFLSNDKVPAACEAIIKPFNISNCFKMENK